MRIVSGIYNGRVIEAPPGRGTRPTTDRVRESLFSSLYSKLGGFDDCIVLDAFAGSGALGIEALSRGAKFATFCEKDKAALNVIQQNLSSLKVDKSLFQIYEVDVFASSFRDSSHQYSLVFLDPPYATEPSEVGKLMANLDDCKSLASNCIVCYEHDTHTDISGFEGALGFDWRHSDDKKYGKTIVSIFNSK